MLLALAVMGAASIFTLQFGYHQTLSQVQHSMQEQARTLAVLAPVSNTVPATSETVRNWFASYQYTHPSTQLTLTDSQATILYDTTGQMGSLQNSQIVRDALRGIASAQTQNRVNVAVPIERQGTILGTVVLAQAPPTITDVAWDWLQIVGYEAASVLLGSIVVGLYFTHGIATPIEEVTRVTGRIAAGAFHERIRLRTRDEFGEMSQSVNRMASKLGEQIGDLMQEKSKLEGIIAYMDSGVIVVDRSGQIAMVNQATERMLRYSTKEMLGKGHWEVGHSYGLSTQIDEVLSRGHKVRTEIHLPNDMDTIIQLNAAPLKGKDDQVAGAVIVMHDISEWKQIENMRTDFVANVSHELRTPITAVRGFAETLLDGALQDPDLAKQFIHIIYQESDRMGRLVNDLLDLSKIEGKYGDWNFTDTDIPELVGEIAERWRVPAEQKGLQLETHLPNDPIYAEVDPDRLAQVLVNLVSNAIAYTPSGGQIDVSVEPRPRELLIHVKDTGIGIPNKDISRLFERFYRVDKARSRQSGGTGLGLAIVKHIMEVHKGTVRVQSRLGHGSTFTVVLPYEQPAKGGSHN